MHLAVKTVLTLLLVLAVTEIGKRSTFWGALLASIPLVSVLSLTWIWLDTGDNEKIAGISIQIFWLVLASLPLFLLLPLLLRRGVSYPLSMTGGLLLTVVLYLLASRLLGGDPGS